MRLHLLFADAVYPLSFELLARCSVIRLILQFLAESNLPRSVQVGFRVFGWDLRFAYTAEGCTSGFMSGGIGFQELLTLLSANTVPQSPFQTPWPETI